MLLESRVVDDHIEFTQLRDDVADGVLAVLGLADVAPPSAAVQWCRRMHG
jgi:hypothetical protein